MTKCFDGLDASTTMAIYICDRILLDASWAIQVEAQVFSSLGRPAFTPTDVLRLVFQPFTDWISGYQKLPMRRSALSVRGNVYFDRNGKFSRHASLQRPCFDSGCHVDLAHAGSPQKVRSIGILFRDVNQCFLFTTFYRTPRCHSSHQ
jgi:hypothetical protein